MNEYELLKAILIVSVSTLIVVAIFLVFFLERHKKRPDPGAELVKWAKEHDHLPGEIRIKHQFEYWNNPKSGDYTEKWWIEEKKKGEA